MVVCCVLVVDQELNNCEKFGNLYTRFNTDAKTCDKTVFVEHASNRGLVSILAEFPVPNISMYKAIAFIDLAYLKSDAENTNDKDN